MKQARSLSPLAAAVLAAWLAAWPAAQAQTVPAAPGATQPAEEALDPPGRVGRIGELTGKVWLFHPDSGEWVDAERNRPLTTGDRLATEGGGRAEVQIGSTTLRLDGGSEVEVMRLDDDRIALQLHNGSLAARLRSAESAREFELTTGEGRFTVQRAGRYRFDRNDAASHVTVYAGQALYEGPGSALTVNANQRAEFWLDDKNAAQYSLSDPVRDGFAGWNSERDRADDRSASTRYVSPEMTGVEDLDRYGRWEQSAEYGALWYPRVVAPGWVPYSTGRWAWVHPWGWTWVDEAPWGFAPFHYGRWVHAHSGWAWAPGAYVRRPVYAPALVAWIGGPQVSLSLHIGGGPAVGWVPLAPREVYVPGYRFSPRYARDVNITHVTNITNITTIVNNPGRQDPVNRKFRHAVTVVPSDVVASRRPVGPEARRWRDTPDARRIADSTTRVAAVATPPVVAPPAVRRQDTRPGDRGAVRVEADVPAPPGRTRLPPNLRPQTPRADERAPATARDADAPVGNRRADSNRPATALPDRSMRPTVPAAPAQAGGAGSRAQQDDRARQAQQDRLDQQLARQRAEQVRREREATAGPAQRAQQMVRQVQEEQRQIQRVQQQAQQQAQQRALQQAQEPARRQIPPPAVEPAPRQQAERPPQAAPRRAISREEPPQRQARGNGNGRAEN